MWLMINANIISAHKKTRADQAVPGLPVPVSPGLPEHLPAHVFKGAHAKQALLSLEQLERQHIADVLDAVRGRKGEAARVLGISRKTLLEKRKRYNLD